MTCYLWLVAYQPRIQLTRSTVPFQDAQEDDEHQQDNDRPEEHLDKTSSSHPHHSWPGGKWNFVFQNKTELSCF